jgi:transposase InsO family protein
MTVRLLCRTFGISRQAYYGAQRAKRRSDHGPQYTGADGAALVTRWGLPRTFAPVGRPTGNAVVERVIRTMKEEVVWLQDWEDAAQLRTALVAWQRRYIPTRLARYSARPHQALDWL